MLIDIIQEELNVPGTLLYLTQFGSHLYGLNTKNSDLDFRGVFIPTLDDLILEKAPDEYNTEITVERVTLPDGGSYYQKEFSCISNNCRLDTIKVDVKLFSLHKFIKLCAKADTNALDVLFSITNKAVEKVDKGFSYIYENRDKLVEVSRLESPCMYAFKQATKYGIKGNRRAKLLYVLDRCKFLSNIHNVEDLIPFIELDNKYLKVDILDNKGTQEKYLNVCGVQHQFNLSIERFKQRIQDKIDKEYTSQRTIDACDGNDWKALSHAIRILLELEELLNTATIKFPVEQKEFLLDIKLGKVTRDVVDSLFDSTFTDLQDKIGRNTLGWSYNSIFWETYIKNTVRNYDMR